VVRAVAFPQRPASGYAVVVDVVVNDHLRQRIRQETGVELSTEEATATSPPLTSFTYLERVDWNSGRAERFELGIRLGIGEMYDKISAAPGLDGTRNVVIILLGLVGGLFLIIQMAALAAGLALARSITGSVHELFAGTERVRQGDFTGKIAVTADDQLGELAQSFNSMTGSIEDLLRQSAEKKRLEEELRIAHEIQMSLLPHGPLQMPGVSVAALCVPAREVGGDYYDFLPLGDRRLGLLIADVSGKGTSAALYMAELKGLVLSLSRIHTSPRELLIHANRLIAQHLDARSFITMTYAVVDLDARTMTYARAGHTPLIYVPRTEGGRRLARILAPDGLVLGLKIDGGEVFEQLLEEDTIPLQAGDLCLFFTDGITEAMNEGDDFFGEARLARVIEDHSHLATDELRERVLHEVTAFVGAAAQHDDMTMILLKIDDLDPLSRTIPDEDQRNSTGEPRPVDRDAASDLSRGRPVAETRS
jgi:sigma-B regulation protein RsbU (phosphoserine phosphatase)